MSKVEAGVRWIQVAAFIVVVALFTADYAFNLMAKEPPIWAYLVPGLLSLGIEAKAIGRLLMQIVRSAARMPGADDDPAP